MACCGLEASHNASAWVADTQINSHQRSNHEFGAIRTRGASGQPTRPGASSRLDSGRAV